MVCQLQRPINLSIQTHPINTIHIALVVPPSDNVAIDNDYYFYSTIDLIKILSMKIILIQWLKQRKIGNKSLWVIYSMFWWI